MAVYRGLRVSNQIKSNQNHFIHTINNTAHIKKYNTIKQNEYSIKHVCGEGKKESKDQKSYKDIPKTYLIIKKKKKLVKKNYVQGQS